MPFWLAAAGAVGVLSRWGVTHLTQRWLGWGGLTPTLLVNVLGCLAFGWCAAALPADHRWRVVVLTGLLGGFTT